VSESTRQWALLKYKDKERGLPSGLPAAKIYTTGKIPWRNIRHCDLNGDDFYRCPHFYCIYANDGMPYEGFGYYLIPGDKSFEFELSVKGRVEPEVLLEQFGQNCLSPRAPDGATTP
jgi:hypothetical protein